MAEAEDVLAVDLKPEGAKKLAAATKGAAGQLRLAVLVDNELVSVPLVQSELSGKVWISGLSGLEKAELEALGKALEQAGKEEAEAEKAE